MHSALTNTFSDFIENATVDTNKSELAVDRIITPEDVTDVPLEEVSKEPSDLPLPVSLLTRSIAVTHDKYEPVHTAFRGLVNTFESAENAILCKLKDYCINIF